MCEIERCEGDYIVRGILRELFEINGRQCARIELIDSPLLSVLGLYRVLLEFNGQKHERDACCVLDDNHRFCLLVYEPPPLPPRAEVRIKVIAERS